ncbi:MarR family transcriptional regulator [Gordonia sp. ABSL11-1]|uniref:MarR family winged helix-turn-helix transcriptional regulator n=1 Tax=Gordonia sp. ABSL11-1 TaxID=3053924 RepID=UPI00257276A3|nr:MarR family transcriptional regulator [Gordonia sp. ABSL11-1]MDL9945622.1 MarR family transcriptional regulator [Gordonia sp. ABSL11-1]
MATTSATQSETVDRIAAAAQRYAAASARIDQIAADTVGLTLSTCEANFINLLRLHGPLTPGRLAELTNLTSSGTTTGVVDRLETAGYAARERCTKDRRKVIVSLDDQRFHAEDAARRQRLSAVLSGYDDAQRATIADFLTRLADVEATVATPS